MVRPTAEPTPGSPPLQHHLVFLQEFLLRDDVADVEQMYADLAAGIEACAGRRAATWDLRNMLVRDGEYLVGVTFAEITSPKVTAQFDALAVEQLVETVVAKLP